MSRIGDRFMGGGHVVSIAADKRSILIASNAATLAARAWLAAAAAGAWPWLAAAAAGAWATWMGFNCNGCAGCRLTLLVLRRMLRLVGLTCS